MGDTSHNEEWQQLLSAFADGECDARERKLATDHLRTCERCRAWLRQANSDQEAFARSLDSSARGMDISDRIMEEVVKMPTPDKPRATIPGAIKPEPSSGGTALLRVRLVEVLAVAVILAIVGAILFPVFAKAREKARVTSCLSNIKQIGLAMLMFAGDHDGKLPDAYRWEEQILPYAANEGLFECPGDEGSKRGPYAMNPRFSGAKLGDFDNQNELIIAYDADELGRPDPRHNGGLNCVFMDGHGKWIKGVPDDISMTTGVAPPTENYGLADKLKMAYTGSAELWVKSVHQAVLAAEKAFADRGGFVLVSSLEAIVEPYGAEIVGRVPTQEVANTINALGALGWVARRELRGEDLTQRYLDKRREVKTQQERQERLTEVVQKASREEHVVAAEENLAGAESAEDEAESDLYDVADRTTLATITATLIQKERDAPAPPPITASWHGAVGALKSVGAFAARLGIWLGVFAWVWLPLVWLAVHRRRRRGQEGS